MWIADDPDTVGLWLMRLDRRTQTDSAFDLALQVIDLDVQMCLHLLGVRALSQIGATWSGSSWKLNEAWMAHEGAPAGGMKVLGGHHEYDACAAGSAVARSYGPGTD